MLVFNCVRFRESTELHLLTSLYIYIYICMYSYIFITHVHKQMIHIAISLRIICISIYKTMYTYDYICLRVSWFHNCIGLVPVWYWFGIGLVFVCWFDAGLVLAWYGLITYIRPNELLHMAFFSVRIVYSDSCTSFVKPREEPGRMAMGFGAEGSCRRDLDV